MMPTRGLRVFAYSMAILRQNGRSSKYYYIFLTPARTLVMSNTRVPANGKVGELFAVAARPRHLEYSEPLKCVRNRRLLENHRETLEVAIRSSGRPTKGRWGNEEEIEQAELWWLNLRNDSRPRLVKAEYIPPHNYPSTTSSVSTKPSF